MLSKEHDLLPYLLGFSASLLIGPVRFQRLYTFFGSVKDAWYAKRSDLRSIGFSDDLIDRFLRFRDRFSFDAYERRLHQKHIRVVTVFDATYPILLRQIPDPPFLLYYRGNGDISLTSHPLPIGAVGTRRATHYGKTVTRRIIQGLVAHGCVIVSGMAKGIDAVAHVSCLDRGGQTIAVLGSGVDVVYPPEHVALYFRIIASGGLILSEMPISCKPQAYMFRLRNRIISGMSRGVLVVEGGKRSGALITAKYAAEQGRDVFAVPGQGKSLMSVGPEILLQQGAIVATSADDIIRELLV